MHANRLMAETQIQSAVIPPSPGTASAMGLLVGDLRHEYSAAMIQRVDEVDAPVVGATLRRLETEGQSALTREGVREEDIVLIRQAEMRYVGQGYELTIALPPDGLERGDLGTLLARFHEEHGRAYGYSAPQEPVEFVNLRVTAIGSIVKPAQRVSAIDDGRRGGVRKSSRPVYFRERGGYVECQVYDRYRLPAGFAFNGPALVEEFDSTTVVHPGFDGRIDRFGNLWLGPPARETA
jgi:N-methylhydantoinase A